MSYGPLIKYGLIVAAVLAFCGALILYGSRLKQQEWDASITQQQMNAGEYIVKNAQNTARIERDYQQQIQVQSVRVKTLERKVRDYEHSQLQKCALSPEFERVFDSLSSLYDPAADRVPAAADAARIAALASPADPVSDAAVLSAWFWLVTEYNALWIDYDTLRTFVRTSHAIATEGAGR